MDNISRRSLLSAGLGAGLGAGLVAAWPGAAVAVSTADDAGIPHQHEGLLRDPGRGAGSYR
ncbi:hypothetical protein GU243_21560 [Pseudarthrobacter psychrotolerans]|uniref:Uncharacterized protein n=1 Tax=Pseudarthrobacter psychrotolerans TaxID=2697569 RepID=A0A6P1NME6_9MICC|nr:hypothetical protein [Pseudarthrobacter psychrotolerans]QHK21825.1 hypothetical protein GU243_21560 [Pseudarthrobacter psychrotolerans]